MKKFESQSCLTQTEGLTQYPGPALQLSYGVTGPSALSLARPAPPPPGLVASHPSNLPLPSHPREPHRPRGSARRKLEVAATRKRVEVRDAGITEPCAWTTRPGPPTEYDGETEAQKSWQPKRRTEAADPSAPLVASPSSEGSAPGARQGKGRGLPLSSSRTRPSHTARARLPGRSAPSLPAPRARSRPATDAGRSGEAAPAASWPQPCRRPAAAPLTCKPNLCPRPPLPSCP